MTTQDALVAATGVSLLSVAVFLIVYAVRARETWWRDPLGRALMLGGLAVGSLSAVGSVRRIDTHMDSVDLAHELIVASTLGYLAVAAVWLYKALVVFKETRRRRDDQRPSPNLRPRPRPDRYHRNDGHD